MVTIETPKQVLFQVGSTHLIADEMEKLKRIFGYVINVIVVVNILNFCIA